MKTITLMMCLLVPIVTHAQGGGSTTVGGGGDLCEDRIKIIRDDIRDWVIQGGHEGLELPNGVSTDQYHRAMNVQISNANIQCVGPGDIGYPVTYNGTPKVCKFEGTSSTSRITCDFSKFQAMNESDQYVLIHHEYAGLANIEIPNGSDSNYEISNQISEYLVDQVVKKLSIKKGSTGGLRNIKSGFIYTHSPKYCGFKTYAYPQDRVLLVETGVNPQSGMNCRTVSYTFKCEGSRCLSASVVGLKSRWLLTITASGSYHFITVECEDPSGNPIDCKGQRGGEAFLQPTPFKEFSTATLFSASQSYFQWGSSGPHNVKEARGVALQKAIDECSILWDNCREEKAMFESLHKEVVVYVRGQAR